MDTRQLEYILAIAEERSLSRAAERLFLSQSALSQQLAKLSREGLPPIFYRRKGEMVLTDAGKIYVNGVRIILKICKDTNDSLLDLGENRMRRLRISVSFRLRPAFYTLIFPWLKSTYPDIELSVCAIPPARIRQALVDREIDLAVFPSMRCANEIIEYTPLRQDELILAYPSGGEYLPVIVPTVGTHLRLICDQVLSNSEFSSGVYAEIDDVSIISELLCKKECTAILPRSELGECGSICTKSFIPAAIYYTVAAYRSENVSSVFKNIVAQFEISFSKF